MKKKLYKIGCSCAAVVSIFSAIAFNIKRSFYIFPVWDKTIQQ